MSQAGAVMYFRTEGDCAISPQHFPQELERRPWLSPAKKVELAALNPQHCLTPNLNAGRLHLLRKGLTLEARRSQLGLYNSTGSLVRKVKEMGCLGNSNCPSSGRVTAPCTPLRSRPPTSLCSPASCTPLVAPVPGAQSSVVTFRFIEKASVKTLNGLPLAECGRESGLSRSLEFGEGLRFGSSKQGSCCPLVQNHHSPLHKAPVALEPGTPDASKNHKASINEYKLASAGPAGAQAASALSIKDQDPLSHKLKLETSASDPLLTGSKFLVGAQSSFSLGNGSLQPLNTTCLSSSLANGMSSPSKDISLFRRSPQSGESQGSPWPYSRQSSAHARRIAKAKWEFFYGSLEPPGTGLSSQKTPDSHPHEKSNHPKQPESDQMVPEHSLCHVEVEIEMTPPGSMKPGHCETGIICRTVKYSETDLDTVPLRCYHETNIDDILAEKDEVDSAIESQKDSESNPSFTGTLGKDSSVPGDPFSQHIMEDDGKCVGSGTRGNEDDEVFEPTRQERIMDRDAQGLLKSPVPFLLGHSLSKDGMDSFSKHFENIMESHRAKGTSYTSLDSIDILSSPAQTYNGTYFTFDLPSLTPEIQERIRDSAKLIEHNLAPLAHLEPDSGTSSATDAPWTEQDEDQKQGGKSGLQSPCLSEDSLGIPLASIISEHHLSQLVSDSDSEMDSTEQLALGSTDTLSNGHKADLEAAKRLAKRLYNLDGFKKADVARHLGKNNDFSKMVAGEYLKFFEFTGMSLDQALRSFLKELALMGETQERERVLAHFSQRYYECNPKAISSEDGAHTLTCALMLLNTDLHGHNIGKRMSCSDFIGNLEGLNGGSDFPRELLKDQLPDHASSGYEFTVLS